MKHNTGPDNTGERRSTMKRYFMLVVMTTMALAGAVQAQATWTVPTELSPTGIQTSVMTVIGPAIAVLIPLTLGFLVVALIVRAVKRGAAKTAK